MATPYLQLRHDRVASTQDLARSELDTLPVVVIAEGQTAGRGRLGAIWETAPRALAVSIALRIDPDDRRPFSLMAGVAARRAAGGDGLKWPNDLMQGEAKVGGILVERSSDIVVIGMGLNLWWPNPPPGFGSLSVTDPGRGEHAGVAALWAAEMMEFIDSGSWPRSEYLETCLTVGRQITWEPNGSGRAVDVDDQGCLVVDRDGTMEHLASGVVRHIVG